MSDLKKIFIIFTVAILLAAICNAFLGGANATDERNTRNIVAKNNTIVLNVENMETNNTVVAIKK